MGAFSIWHLAVLLVLLCGGMGIVGVVLWQVVRLVRPSRGAVARLPSVAERLRELDVLKAEGLISAAEYERQRAAIVQGI